MTITQQQIIELAVEAGLAEVTDTAESLPVDYVEALAKFAELAYRRGFSSEPVAWIDKHGEIFKELESVLPTDTPLYALQKGESPC